MPEYNNVEEVVKKSAHYTNHCKIPQGNSFGKQDF